MTYCAFYYKIFEKKGVFHLKQYNAKRFNGNSKHSHSKHSNNPKKSLSLKLFLLILIIFLAVIAILYFKFSWDISTSSNTNVEENISAPIYEGQKVGEVIFSLDGQEIGRTNIVTNTTIAKKTFSNLLSYTYQKWCCLLRE